MCRHHGNTYEAGFINGCWECDMEYAIAERDDDAERRRMARKFGQ